LEEVKETGVLEILRTIGYRAVLAGEAVNTVPLQEESDEPAAPDAEGDKENQPVTA
jgi:hypothetical protein